MCIRDRPPLEVGNHALELFFVGVATAVLLEPELDFFALAARQHYVCLLYTSDAADERSSVDLGGRRIIKKKKKQNI